MVNDRRPLVSVAVPCFNHGGLIAEAVASALSQTYGNVEVIIADDASTDGRTQDVIRRLERGDSRVKAVFREGNGCSGACRNTAIRASRGELILPLDADDVIRPEFLERTVPVLLDHPEVGFVYTDTELFGAQTGINPAEPFDLVRVLAVQTFGCTVLYRRSDFDRTGGYCESMPRQHHWDFVLQLLELGLIGYHVPEALFCYRQTDQETATDASLRVQPESLRAMVARHRGLYEKHWEGVLFCKDEQIASLLHANRQLSRWAEKVTRTWVYRVYRAMKRLSRHE
jgi:glycosyltransferase involved in cell wall biosynthesis